MEVESMAVRTFDLPQPPFSHSPDLELEFPAAAEAEFSSSSPSSVAPPEEERSGDANTGSWGIFADDPEPIGDVPESKAATKLQKVYRSYRTRRRLADSAVVAEELWWQVIDYARLNLSTVSFFNYLKPETAISRWNRISLNASKVGKGLSKDNKALKLAFQHWIEAIDPRHRYGHNLHMYYEKWCESTAGQPFFYWLDIGDGRDVDLEECPRSLLKQQCIKYLGPQEREHYEYILVDGMIVHEQTGQFLDTTKESRGAKWIFVMSTSKRLYAGQKKKGMFHHSSFLAGGATLSAGRFTAENGLLKEIWAYSGHYRPTEEYLDYFLSFLEESGVNLNEILIHSSSNEEYYDEPKPAEAEAHTQTTTELFTIPTPKPVELVMPEKLVKDQPASEKYKADEPKVSYKRTLSGGLQSPRTDVPQKAIEERIKSKREANSYQLGHQLLSKWSTGAGPRIGCMADYPAELRMQALEMLNLSPRMPPTPSYSRYLANSCLSPTSTSPTCNQPSVPL